ncbi:RDD family protein [Schlesneria paludicola]|uniref:RDD family protein n=1 Tax=Schlesneria paludicola TaxID=360056 RepID=UPI00029AC77F|nr:RDD family protein [Schlesneria paludicola]
MNDFGWSFRRIAASAAFVLVSLVLPLGIIGLTVASLVSGDATRTPEGEWKCYDGGVLDQGSLVFPVQRNLRGISNSTMGFEARIRRLDLKSGVESDTGVVVANQGINLQLVNEELLVWTRQGIHRWDDSSLVKIADSHSCLRVRNHPFLYDEHLTQVVEAEDGGFRLMHLIDDAWVKGLKIRLPETDCDWHEDPKTGKARLQSRAPSLPLPTGGAVPWIHLMVAQHAGKTHLLLNTIPNGLYAYRHGFEFEDPECASAQAPANASVDVSGWEPVPLLVSGDRCAGIVCDRDGLLVASTKSLEPIRMIRRTDVGHWQEVVAVEGVKLRCTPQLFVDAATETAYVFDAYRPWSYAALYPIEQNSILPADPVWSLEVRKYLARWLALLAAVLVGWLVHLITLTCGTELLALRRPENGYEFGNQSAILATTWRRGFAFSVDALAVALILSMVLAISLRDPNLRWHDGDERDLCQTLYDVEDILLKRPRESDQMNLANYPRFEYFATIFRGRPDLYSSALATSLIVCGLKIYVEGRFGVTPGKWFMGIRSVGSTLRPCGFARALVRRVLYVVDILCFITPLPAAISMMFSSHRQRLGDRVSDTVVIRRRSGSPSRTRLEIKHPQN